MKYNINWEAIRGIYCEIGSAAGDRVVLKRQEVIFNWISEPFENEDSPFENISNTLVPSVGPLIPLFWISADIFPGFQSRSLTCMIILRFILPGGLAIYLQIIWFFKRFRGTTDTPVLYFWLDLPWVLKSGWIPSLHALSPTCNGFLSFTSGATPADLLAAKPFSVHVFAHVHTSIGGARVGAWACYQYLDCWISACNQVYFYSKTKMIVQFLMCSSLSLSQFNQFIWQRLLGKMYDPQVT